MKKIIIALFVLFLGLQVNAATTTTSSKWNQAAMQKKLNNIEIKRDLHPNKWKLLDSFIKFLYPLYKKQGEHLFDTLRNIFKLMDKNSTD